MATDDLISRQALVDALWCEREKLDAYMDECLEKGLSVLRSNAKVERNRIEEDINIISGFPAAVSNLTQVARDIGVSAEDVLNQSVAYEEAGHGTETD